MIDLEKSILNKVAVLDDLRMMWDRGLRPEVFVDPINAEIYAFAIEYFLDHGMKLAPTDEMIKHEFKTFRPGVSDEATDWLVDALQRQYTVNTGQALLLAVGEELADDPDAAMDRMYAEAWKARQAVMPRSNRVNLADNIDQRRQRYLDALDQESVVGATIGFSEVDEHVGWIQPSELAIAAANTKVGKSFLLCNAAVKARRAGHTPVVFCLEQAVTEFEDRLDCFASGVGYGKHQRKLLAPDELNRLHAAQEELRDLGPLHIEQPRRGERTVADLVNRCRQLGGTYLIIDQLSHMDVRESRWKQETTEKHAEIVFDLKDEIGDERNGKLPCLMAVQLNRTAAASGELPGMHQIANSSDIERTVDIAYSISRTKEQRANNTMVLDVMGSRRSDPNRWLLNWVLGNRTEISVIGEWSEDEAVKSA